MITQEQMYRLETEGINYFDKELSKELDDNDYWTILRAIWISDGKCNEIYEKLFFSSGRKREHKIMKSSDRQALKKLPKKITIYRVCKEKDDESKWNWSVNKDFCEKYKSIEERKNFYIAEKEINKSEVFAYFNSRGENEVILKK